MTTWRHTLAVAQRRASLHAAVAGGTAALLAGACLAFVWAVVATAFEWSVNWPLTGAAVAGVTLLGAVAGVLRRPSELAVAVALDAHGMGHDAIATAVQFSAKGSLTPLEAKAVSDADAAALNARPSEAFPWQPKRPMVLTAAAVALFTAAAFIPARWVSRSAQLVGVNAGPPRAEVQQALEDAAAAERLIEAVQQPVAPLPADAVASASVPDPLADLKQQLQQGDISPKELTQQAATAVERAADQLDRRASESQQAHELLRDRLAQAQQSASAPPGDSQAELTKALREGDLDRAVAEAERLTDAADKLAPEDRARLAEDLKRLAGDLSRAPEPPPTARPPVDSAANPSDDTKPQQPMPADTDRQQPARDLADKLEQAAQGLQPTPPADRPPSSLPEQAKPPEQTPPSEKPQTPDAARPPTDPPAKPDQTGSPAKPGEKSPQATDPRGAKSPQGQTQPEAGNPAKPEPSKPEPSKPEPSKPEPGKPDASKQLGEQKAAGGGGEQQPADPQQGQGSGAQQRPAPGDSPAQGRQQPQPKGEKGSQKPSPGDPSKPSETDAPTEGQDKASPAKPTDDRSKDPTSAGKPEAGGTPKPDSTEPGSPKDGQPTPSADNPPTDAPSAKEGLKQLRDQLKKLADQPRNAGQDRQDAQKLREQAQKMWDNASPEQRKEMEQLARELAKERGNQGPQRADKGERPGAGSQSPDPDGGSDQPPPGGGGASDPSLANSGRGPGDGEAGVKPPMRGPSDGPTAMQDIDARSKGATEAPSRVIAEWLTNKPAPGAEGSGNSAPAEVAQAVKQAQQNAEQAVQQRTVPSRLSPLIRRYFDRLPSALGTQPAPPAPATSPAPAAPVPPATVPPTPKP